MNVAHVDVCSCVFFCLQDPFEHLESPVPRDLGVTLRRNTQETILKEVHKAKVLFQRVLCHERKENNGKIHNSSLHNLIQLFISPQNDCKSKC